MQNMIGDYDHELKTWPQFFEPVSNGIKKFEVRSNLDRTFETGQHILLREWGPTENQGYTERWLHVLVTYVMNGGIAVSVPSDICVFSFVIVDRSKDKE